MLWNNNTKKTGFNDAKRTEINASLLLGEGNFNFPLDISFYYKINEYKVLK